MVRRNTPVSVVGSQPTRPIALSCSVTCFLPFHQQSLLLFLSNSLPAKALRKESAIHRYTRDPFSTSTDTGKEPPAFFTLDDSACLFAMVLVFYLNKHCKIPNITSNTDRHKHTNRRRHTLNHMRHKTNAHTQVSPDGTEMPIILPEWRLTSPIQDALQ